MMPSEVNPPIPFRSSMLASAALAIALLLAGFGESAVAQPPGERTIHLQATEMDAYRAADRFPKDFPGATRRAFPQYFGDPDDHSDQGGAPGYYLFLSGEDEFRIGSYMWLPQGDFVVYQGQRITLEMLGVRGTTHQSVLLDPEGKELAGFTVYRGGLEVVDFTVEKVGVYRLICLDHQPTMTLHIHSLPSP
jgi:hypothetical protein